MKSETTIIVKKKKASHEGGHGGSWKVAYADFVTSMMAFFMVMWIMGLSADVRAKIQSYFNDPLGFSRKPPRTKTVIRLSTVIANYPKGGPGGEQGVMSMDENELHSLKREVQKKLLALNGPSLQKILKNVNVRMTTQGLLIEFLEENPSTFFQIGSAAITPQAREIFLSIAAILAKSERQMVINGFTDARPYPSSSYDNWDLSADRALALKRVLLAGKVKSAQIMDIRAYADHRLRDPKDPYSYLNRRVTILLPYLNGNPSEISLPKEKVKTAIKQRFEKSFDIAPTSFPVTTVPTHLPY